MAGNGPAICTVLAPLIGAVVPTAAPRTDERLRFVGIPGSKQEHAAMLPLPHPKVVSQTVSDGGVLLDTAGEVYFGLNAVGMRIWQLLPPSCTTLDELCATLTQAYPDVAPDQLRQDVAELLDQLVQQGLLVPADTAA